MANKTIAELTALSAAPASDDKVPIWDTSAGAYKYVTRANLLGGYMTGGGTIATGGFTGTLPATGTLSLLGTAQTFTALKTFSSGINLGDDTISHYIEGTWTPTITAATTNPTLTYTTQSGAYTRIGRVMFYDAFIVIDTLSDGGSGEWRFSLPGGVARAMNSTASLSGVDIPANTVTMYYRAVAGATYGVVRPVIDNAATTVLTGTNFASGDTVQYSGFYFVT